MASVTSSEAYAAARQSAAVIDRTDRGWIYVTGRDRKAFLHGLLTNDIAALQEGQGCYAALLTPQGRMVADLWVYELGDLILLATDSAIKDPLLARLDRLVFAEDVQPADATDIASAAVVGPDSSRIVASVLPALDARALAALSDHGSLQARFEDQRAIVVRITDPGEGGFEILVQRGQVPLLRGKFGALGLHELDPLTADAMRIEAGIPKFRVDMDEETIPLEAGIESRAISFTKGCYVGQEVIVRVLHRGHGRVVRRLVGLTLEAPEVPESGAQVFANEKGVGRVTSACESPALQRRIALAYVHRDVAEPGTRLSVARADAVVTALPFVPR